MSDQPERFGSVGYLCFLDLFFEGLTQKVLLETDRASYRGATMEAREWDRLSAIVRSARAQVSDMQVKMKSGQI